MESSIVGAKDQVVIPKKIRAMFHIKKGDSHLGDRHLGTAGKGIVTKGTGIAVL